MTRPSYSRYKESGGSQLSVDGNAVARNEEISVLYLKRGFPSLEEGYLLSKNFISLTDKFRCNVRVCVPTCARRIL